MTTPVIAVAGLKNSGKTALIRMVVAELRLRNVCHATKNMHITQPNIPAHPCASPSSSLLTLEASPISSSRFVA